MTIEDIVGRLSEIDYQRHCRLYESANDAEHSLYEDFIDYVSSADQGNIGRMAQVVLRAWRPIA